MAYGDQIPPEKVRHNLQAGSGPIAKLGGLEPETLVPVPLELPRKIFQPSTVKDFMPERPENGLNTITESRPEGGRPQGMHRRAVRAAIFDRPDRLEIALEIAGNVAVNPDPSPLTLRTSRRPRPRVSLPFFRQPLYFYPKMKYQ
jgi:hypothetical protein